MIDVNEWIVLNECAECFLPHLNTRRDLLTRSHPSEGENRIINHGKIARVNRFIALRLHNWPNTDWPLLLKRLQCGGNLRYEHRVTLDN